MPDNDQNRRFALEAANIGVWVVSMKGDPVYWDAQTRQILGVPLDEPATLEYSFSIIHPDDRQRAREVFARAIDPASNGEYIIENRVVWADGSIHWVLSKGKRRYQAADGGAEASYLVGTVVDITERKGTEAALQVSEEKYRALFDLFSQGFCICEMLVDANNKPYDYRFLEVNQLFEDQTGLKNATGKTALELLPNLEQHWIDIYGKVALTGEPLRFEQGSEVMGRWFDVYAFRFGKAESHQFAIVFNDISERRQAEEHGRMLRILASSLSREMTWQEITKTIIQKGIDGSGAAGGVVALLNDDKTQLEIIGSLGYEDATLANSIHIPLDDTTSPLSEAVRKNRQIWMHMPEVGSRIIPLLDGLHQNQNWSWAALPFNINDEVIGVIGLDFNTAKAFNAPEQNFLVTLTEYCAQALHRAKLTEQIGLSAVAEERQRISRDLHDSVKQLLFTSSMIAESIPRVWDQHPQKARTYADEIVTLNQAALAELQSLLLELRPASLLASPFMSLVDDLSSALRGHRAMQINIHYDGPDDMRLPPNTHIAAYRVMQETLNNINKHSEATQVYIDCVYNADLFRMRVHDNGKGFDSKRTSVGLGLNTMRERAENLGATFSIHSVVGEGTTVTAEWPLKT